jgi:hypothetical protein
LFHFMPEHLASDWESVAACRIEGSGVPLQVKRQTPGRPKTERCIRFPEQAPVRALSRLLLAFRHHLAAASSARGDACNNSIADHIIARKTKNY